MTKLLYLDQNAWVALARGAWDKATFPNEYLALSKVIEGVEAQAWMVALSYTNIYETAKINDPIRRANMARTQAVISGGKVFRSRRRIFGETLASYLATRFSLSYPAPSDRWYLSDLWFETAADYTPDLFDYTISEAALDFMRKHPVKTLFDYLALSDERIRIEAVRRYSASSVELIARIEARRAIVAGQTLAIRKRAYGGNLIIDEIDFILATGRQLGLAWATVSDLGSSLVRSLTLDVPVLNVELQLAVRIEDQTRGITENDLRDLASFSNVLPLADILIAEKPFVNLARQAKLGERYGTTLLTSIYDLPSASINYNN